MASARDDLAPLKGPLPDWFRGAFEVPRREGVVDVSGCPIHFFAWGDPAAPPVLMTHGFLAHARVFAFIAPLLAHRFHLVSYDLSSMGDSGPRSESLGRAEEALAVARETGLLDHAKKPIFVAHSFGGTVAIEAAEQHPEVFGGLIICDLMMVREARLRAMFGAPAPEPKSPPPSEPRTHKVYPDLSSALERYRLTPGQPCANTYLLEYMAHHSLRSVPGGFVWKFSPHILEHDRRTSRLWLDITQRFAALKTRKAIVHGRKSKLFDEDSVALVEGLAGPTVPIVGIPEAHHHLMLDQPLAFSTALETLLSHWTAVP